MTHLKYTTSVFALLFAMIAFGQTPILNQKKSVLLKNGFLHIGNGKTISKAYIGFEDGKINLVKDMLTYTLKDHNYDTVIDLKGQHVYPGFINMNNKLGITEIDAVRSTRDFAEVGKFKPHVRSQIAFNTESVVASTVRTNGVLITQATPKRGVISGTSSLMNLDGWNWEDATLVQDDGIHLNWARLDENPQDASKHLKNYEKNLKELETYFASAKSFYESSKKDNSNAQFLAMEGLFSGKKRLYIRANDAKQLIDIMAFCKKFEVKYPVIVGGAESYLVAEELKSMKIPVLIRKPHSLPTSEDALVDESFALAKKLEDAELLFGIQTSGDMEAMNARNLPFNAGTARAYGLENEKAVASISLNVAKIAGVEHLIGSIEEGKLATLFVSKGDALDQLTNDVTLAFINGKRINLENHQKRLYRTYSNKLGLEIKE